MLNLGVAPALVIAAILLVQTAAAQASSPAEVLQAYAPAINVEDLDGVLALYAGDVEL